MKRKVLIHSERKNTVKVFKSKRERCNCQKQYFVGQNCIENVHFTIQIYRQITCYQEYHYTVESIMNGSIHS